MDFETLAARVAELDLKHPTQKRIDMLSVLHPAMLLACELTLNTARRQYRSLKSFKEKTDFYNTKLAPYEALYEKIKNEQPIPKPHSVWVDEETLKMIDEHGYDEVFKFKTYLHGTY